MTDIDELTSKKASVRLKVEVANGGITNSIIGNEPAALFRTYFVFARQERYPT